MLKRILRNRFTLLTILCASLLLSGCYNKIAVRPTDLPKLNNTYSRTVGSGYSYGRSYRVVRRSVRRLRGPSGQVVEVTGKTDVHISTRRGNFTFKHPTIARLEKNNLIIAGGNRGNTVIPLSEINKSEIEKMSTGKTVFAIVGGTFLGTGLLVFGLLAALGAL